MKTRLFILAAFTALPAAAQLRITEICPQPATTHPTTHETIDQLDPNGKVSGWIELENTSATDTVDLGNYQIAWYMGLYLCVFLQIPFLNRAWYALNEKEQNILLGTLGFLCTIYPAFKYVGPSYFIGVYPVLFYFLGIAVSDRKWRVNRLLLLAVLVAKRLQIPYRSVLHVNRC